MDPNEMIGPSGFGPNGFLALGDRAPYAYRIDFENMTNATAPAQQVIITDPLNTNLDWTTFKISEFGFGDLIVPLPLNVQHVETNLTVNYLGAVLQVQIQIGIDPASGVMRAQFQSIDPATSLPPPVQLGFLPPEDGTGRGQGHVTYSVRPRSGVATGIQMRNIALISFDNQTLISTDQIDPLNAAAGVDPARQCLITFDAGAPISHVLPLPAQSQELQVLVSWTGQDDAGGSGVASYDVYVSDNGGAWSLWQGNATVTTAVFQGLPQHSYGFKTIARDYAGNVEAQHGSADATTQIVANPGFQLTVNPGSTNLNLHDTFIYTVTIRNLGSVTLNNVVMSNTVPAGISPQSTTQDHGSSAIGAGSLVWALGTMNANDSATMSVTATAAVGGTWTNICSAWDSGRAVTAAGLELIQIGGGGTAPSLGVGLAGQGLTLTWPATATGYYLETTSSLLTEANWTPVTNPPALLNGQNTVELPLAELQRFYRLHAQ